MTLNSSIITDAYRESNFTAQGGTLTTEEQNEGLALLQSLVNSFPGFVLGTKLKPWWIPNPHGTATEVRRYPASPGEPSDRGFRHDSYPPSNSRVILRTETPETIFFQYEPQDGAIMQIVDSGFTADVTLDANGNFFGFTGADRTIPLASTIGTGTRVPPKTYVFRGDIASWIEVSDLAYGGEMPYPPEFDDYWITSLAIRLSPRFGNKPQDATMMRYKDMSTFVRGHYRQTAETVIDGPRLAQQSHGAGDYRGDPDTGRV